MNIWIHSECCRTLRGQFRWWAIYTNLVSALHSFGISALCKRGGVQDGQYWAVTWWISCEAQLCSCKGFALYSNDFLVQIRPASDEGIPRRFEDSVESFLMAARTSAPTTCFVRNVCSHSCNYRRALLHTSRQINCSYMYKGWRELAWCSFSWQNFKMNEQPNIEWPGMLLRPCVVSKHSSLRRCKLVEIVLTRISYQPSRDPSTYLFAADILKRSMRFWPRA